MVNFRGEVDLGRFERVIGRELNRQEEDSSTVRTVSRTHDRRLPFEEIVSGRTGRARRGRVSSEIDEFLYKPGSTECQLNVRRHGGGAGEEVRVEMKHQLTVDAFQSHCCEKEKRARVGSTSWSERVAIQTEQEEGEGTRSVSAKLSSTRSGTLSV